MHVTPILFMSEVNEKEIDALLHDFNQPGAPGAAVMIVQKTRTVFAKAYGLADLERKIPCTTKTNFRLASVTKQFTAMAILILAEKGKLSLGDSITKSFPEFPDYGKPITVRHLLTHTSGLLDYEDSISPGTTLPLSDRDVLFIMCQQSRTEFAPGTQFHYSNSGYALLALMVESVAGKTFTAFLRGNIFEPLGMTNSSAYVAGFSTVPNRAFGYAEGKDGWEFSDQSLTSAVLGDGGVYASVVDLYLWDQALYTDKLISRKLLREGFTIHSNESDFKGSGYGYGWYLGQYRGSEHIWHYGSTCGFSTKIDRFPEKNLTVILLANRCNAEISPVVQKIVDLAW